MARHDEREASGRNANVWVDARTGAVRRSAFTSLQRRCPDASLRAEIQSTVRFGSSSVGTGAPSRGQLTDSGFQMRPLGEDERA